MTRNLYTALAMVIFLSCGADQGPPNPKPMRVIVVDANPESAERTISFLAGSGRYIQHAHTREEGDELLAHVLRDTCTVVNVMDVNGVDSKLQGWLAGLGGCVFAYAVPMPSEIDLEGIRVHADAWTYRFLEHHEWEYGLLRLIYQIHDAFDEHLDLVPTNAYRVVRGKVNAHPLLSQPMRPNYHCRR